MKLDQYINIDDLDRLIEDGYVSCKEHNVFPLRIYNYTKRAASLGFNRWPGTLERCRGLIVDSDDNIVAFGLRKFWNYVEVDDQGLSFTAHDKVDGSIGIVFLWKGQVYISTRGSFHSEMADWANDFLDKNPEYREYLQAPIIDGSPWYTPHVEIVYDDNRIVCDYDYEDLVLLGYNDDHSWTPASQQWRYPGRIAETFNFNSMTELLNSDYRVNTEGFVIQYSDGTMKKVKYGQYIELQRAIINMTERTIYNKLCNEGVPAFHEWVLKLPNEFHREAYQIAQSISMDFSIKRYELEQARSAIMNAVNGTTDRKAVAIYMQAHNTPGWIRSGVFAYMDGNDNARKAIIWKQIKR